MWIEMMQFAILPLEEDIGFPHRLFRIRFLQPPWKAASLATVSIVCSKYIIFGVIFSLSVHHYVGEGIQGVRGDCESPYVNQREVGVCGTCLLPARLCFWKLTSCGAAVPTDLSPAAGGWGKKHPILPTTPCNLQTLEKTKIGMMWNHHLRIWNCNL